MTEQQEKERASRMERALLDIIEECPNPKLPYSCKVVELAKNALVVPYVE